MTCPRYLRIAAIVETAVLSASARGIQKVDPSLSDREIEALAAWMDNGAPLDNSAETPRPKQFPPVGAWNLPTPPDLIASALVWTVPAVGGDTDPDIGHAPIAFTQDRWIKSFEVREFRPDEQRPAALTARHGMEAVI